MKTALGILLLVLSSVFVAHVHAQHQAPASLDQNQNLHPGVDSTPDQTEPVTVSIRWSDSDLCAMPFYVDVYELTVSVFAAGAENVVLTDYADRVFELVRASQEYGESAGAFIEHIHDIPRQLLEIIREDSSVLASCANFSVALIGPP